MERKEAIEVVKKNWPDSSFTRLREALETLIPELKESEDEKIRKALIKYLDALDDDEIRYGVSFKDMRAWLEKQSKASKVEQAMREVEEKADAFTEAHKGETSDEILAQMRGEQKPAWSEEDEKILEIITSVLQVNFEPTERFSGYEEYMNVDLINWLKSLKDRVQPKQEWSEKDKCMLNNVIDTLKPLSQTTHSGYAINSMIDWLKSLKERYTWKPTKEQLTELRCVISGCGYDIEPLVELEKGLKAL